MKAKKFFSLGICFLTVVLLCGFGNKADIQKSVDQIKKEIQGMSMADLQNKAKIYGDAIRAKKADLEKIGTQVKALAPAELLSAKAKGIKDQYAKVHTEVSALTERYKIYAQKFQEIGGDISKIKIA